MTEYEKQAIDFLVKTGCKITFKFEKKGFHFSDDLEKRNIYRIYMTTSKGRYNFKFGDSLNNTENGIIPKFYDFLSCLCIDYSVDFQDFCDSMGYDTYIYNDAGNYVRNSNIYKVFLAVQKQNNGLNRLFNENEIDLLHEIN